MNAARRRAYDQPIAAPSRPLLRVVPKQSRHGSISPRSRKTTQSQVLFRTCCAMMVVFAALGLLRISLSVSAAEAAIDSQRLERSIKEEALRAKVLEADRSALGAPSRIAAIAGCTLEMTESGQVSYICLPATDDTDGAGDSRTAVAAAGSKTDAGGTATAVKSVIANVLDIAAGEAQVLLVGDVGLSSTR